MNETDFKVRFLEKPTFKIGFGLARVPLFEIKRQDTVSVICGRQNYKVKEFQLVAFFRETNTFKIVKNYGAKLSDDAKRLFDQLKLEDSVTFDSIISTDSKGNDIHVSPSTITVH